MNILAQSRQNLASTFGSDVLASVVVFLVALPLCMGIALASGVPPALGLVTGIVGGLVVGAIAGSPLQVSGPAAGLTVLVFQVVSDHGVGMLGPIVLLAGVVQIALGAMKLGQWFRAISPAVIQGMLAGIGALIVASQLHVLIDDKPQGSGLDNLIAIPGALVKALTPSPDNMHTEAAIVGLLALAVMIAWGFVPKKAKLVPAPLVAVVVAALATFTLGIEISHVEVPANLLDVVSLPNATTLGGLFTPAVLGSALAIALIASAETLLCATAVDRMHDGPRTAYNRELLAQGVGNTICGALGALPMTGVIVRSSANVAAGGKTRLSAILHGAWILAFVVALPFVLNLIPTAALAAILVYTGFKLLAPTAVRELAKFGKWEVAIYVATLVAIVATNLLEGVLIGLAISVAKIVYTFTHLAAERADGPAETTVALEGSATFVRLPVLAAALEGAPADRPVRLDISRLLHADHACVELIDSWREQREGAGQPVYVDRAALLAKCHDWAEHLHRHRTSPAPKVKATPARA